MEKHDASMSMDSPLVDSQKQEFVWVKPEKEGLAQAAFLIEEYEILNLIQWQETEELEWVHPSRVSRRRTSPRKRSRSSSPVARKRPSPHGPDGPVPLNMEATLLSSPTKSEGDIEKASPRLESIQSNQTDSGGDNDDQDTKLAATLTRGDASPTWESAVPSDQEPDAKPRFSERSSAYLQSLAEISHAVLWDVRWRVGTKLKRLVSWEAGEDLSAVLALSRRYLPWVPPMAPQPCQCLLCQPQIQLPSASREETESTSSVNNGADKEETEENEAYDRALNLYARLYFRKGPWFRIDGLLRYYAPKKPQSQSLEPDPPKSPVDITHDNANMPASPSKFFLAKPSKANNSTPTPNGGETTATVDTLIDHNHVNAQLEAVAVLLHDVKQLIDMGLLRSFRDEEECGKTVGQVRKHGLFRQEEQRQVLAKLGGGRTSRRTPPPPKKASTNLIWKQMCQQQSIRMSTSTEKSILLPVSKHVDQTVVSSWASSITVKGNMRDDYLPAAAMKSVKEPVEQILQELLKETLGTGESFAPFGISRTCFRLREDPLRTLRRCCRLYLCATSGPGDMRGDSGTNGWKSLPETNNGHQEDILQGRLAKLPMATNNVAPPGTNCWNTTMYPGRDFRFKLTPCSFRRAYRPLLLSDQDVFQDTTLPETTIEKVQVFPSVDAFQLWEFCVELRANVDYLIELNDLLLYTERKKAREEADGPNDEAQNEEGEPSSEPDEPPVADEATDEADSPVDFMGMLTLAGRTSTVQRFLSNILDSFYETDQNPKSFLAGVEEDVGPLLAPTGPHARLENECEQVLGVIGVIATHVLSLRNQTASSKDISRSLRRPWLRHLWWEGCLAYVLWDVIPILEKRGFYGHAVKALETLLFGKMLPRTPQSDVVPETLVVKGDGNKGFLALAYMSRRARGKAYERLMIDFVHILRQRQKQNSLKAVEQKDDGDKPSKSTRKRKKKRKTDKSEVVKKPPTPNDLTASLCKELLASCVSTGQITFCATRVLARRMKQPLSDTLLGLAHFEAQELGHRLESDPVESLDSKPNTDRYSDWAPITDFAVANAMETEEVAVGGRCSYIGFEEQSSGNFGSLNVEELAMEYYNTGRLPANDQSTVKGGWVGWHDEGGKVRSLFRVLSSATILGMDWGCQQGGGGISSEDNATIHLTPYQGAPFDLHVGAERSNASGEEDDVATRRGFYERRKDVIDRFLDRLTCLQPEELAQLVYSSIHSRLQYCININHLDPALERDIKQMRTLSLLAAGFGGELLAAVFRCFFFDYRHYSGGLPDLTLVRAVFEATEKEEESLVDMGTFVGECFSPEHRAELESQRVASMFEDQDDEFLGCNKVGDSGARMNNRFGRGGRQGTQRGSTTATPKQPSMLELAEHLPLTHNGRKVRVECMLVEVKSMNDRLDPRQEDWLNILDRHGNARVCKFGKPKKPKKAAKGKENRDQGNGEQG